MKPSSRRSTELLFIGVIGLLVFGCVLGSKAAYATVDTNGLVFVNVDHAAIGTYSTFSYGAKTDRCGLGQSSASIPYGNGGGGVVIALSGPNSIQAMPFVTNAANIASTAAFFADADVRRGLTPCTDQWTIESAGFSFTHYTPAWSITDMATATLAEQRRYFLPATWMQFTIVNTNDTAEDFYFGLRTNGVRSIYANGAYEGFAVGEAALAVQAGTCELLNGSSLSQALNGMSSGFAFHLNIPAGETRSLTLVVANYRSTVLDTRVSAKYYYTSLFDSMDSVIDTAFAEFADARLRSGQIDASLAGANLNVFRQFLTSQAMHSYQACTCAVLDGSGNFGWREYEGEYNYINTLDLTVDHAYYDCIMHPWALRNVLDTYSGKTNGSGYSFTRALYNSSTGVQVSSSGFGFHHDMGSGARTDAPGTTASAYENSNSFMGQEELQNWILCAGMYWHYTGDNDWLANNASVLQNCLNSMLIRDDVTASARDGVTTYLNRRTTSTYEITTYDSLDASLKSPKLNAMTTVKNWASYIALQAMFTQIGDTANAATCSKMASLAAQSIVTAWQANQSSRGYIPAFLDGSNGSAIIPIVEGLAYPTLMGLTNAIDPNGPYASMLDAISNHIAYVLSPGICLDAASGGWKLTSANNNTWQSKVYLAQFVIENILGVNNTNVNGYIDQIHATFQVAEAPYQGWSDQLNSTGSGSAIGSRHYPRGITSALWWLNRENNPAFPVRSPGRPTGVTAIAKNQQIVVLWNGSELATSYNIWRSTDEGGPYEAIAMGVTGASYTDSDLTNGVTYYYSVTAANDLGQSKISNRTSATPAVQPPSMVSAVARAGSINLSWSAVSGVSNFRILRSLVHGSDYTIVSTNTQTAFTDYSVVNGTTYYYVIQSIPNAGQDSIFSMEVSATPSYSIPFFAVNCGGPVVGSFGADAWFTGGGTYSTTTAIDTNGVPNAAPAALYQTERYSTTNSNVSYTFPALTPSTPYLVRLHFAEIYTTTPNARVFNVFINGEQVLTNFDIFATAGTNYKAVVREFIRPADAIGQLVIVATNYIENAKFSGIEILSPWAFLPQAGTNLTTSVTETNFTITWPNNYTGWILQTNGGDLLNPAAWGDVPGSETNSQMSFPTGDPALPQEFFRLRHP